ncbi:MAG: hypothetical protein ABEI52_05640 [Halobacteriaceae archaeon]
MDITDGLRLVNGIDMGLTIGVLALLVFVGYFVYEIREGYRTGSESELELMLPTFGGRALM